jgi:hypothetical protein
MFLAGGNKYCGLYVQSPLKTTQNPVLSTVKFQTCFLISEKYGLGVILR